MLLEQVQSVVNEYREKYDNDVSCGEIAKVVLGELTKHGHHAVLVDTGSHVVVLNHTTREIWDLARDLTDIPGSDEVISLDDPAASIYLSKTPYAAVLPK